MVEHHTTRITAADALVGAGADALRVQRTVAETVVGGTKPDGHALRAMVACVASAVDGGDACGVTDGVFWAEPVVAIARVGCKQKR